MQKWRREAEGLQIPANRPVMLARSMTAAVISTPVVIDKVVSPLLKKAGECAKGADELTKEFEMDPFEIGEDVPEEQEGWTIITSLSGCRAGMAGIDFGN